jgi:hypothetical protein
MRQKKSSIRSLLFIFSVLFLFSMPNISWTEVSKDENSNKEEIRNLGNSPEQYFNNYITEVYRTIGLQQTGLALPVFEKAMTGFINLKNRNFLNNNKEILTVVDYTKPSTEKRMWIIDLANNSILLNTYVAHGQGSGDNIATKFSNVAESHQSSVGFFLTNETYSGKHGLSLKLDGLDKGINSKARDRAIVVHGASYVSENFINQHGRLGRSHGCPAIPKELNQQIINLIKDKTCFFINGNTHNYQSDLLSKDELFTSFSSI